MSTRMSGPLSAERFWGSLHSGTQRREHKAFVFTNDDDVHKSRRRWLNVRRHHPEWRWDDLNWWPVPGSRKISPEGTSTNDEQSSLQACHWLASGSTFHGSSTSATDFGNIFINIFIRNDSIICFFLGIWMILSKKRVAQRYVSRVTRVIFRNVQGGPKSGKTWKSKKSQGFWTNFVKFRKFHKKHFR